MKHLLPPRIFAAVCALLPLTQPLHAQKSASTSTTTSAPSSLDALLASANPWEMTPDQLEAAMKPLRTQWLSAAKDSARYFGNYAIWNGAIPVKEAVVEFQNGKLFRVNLSIFNRGDSDSDGFASRAEFERRLDAWKAAITAKAGVQPVDLGRQNASAVKAMGFSWSKAPSVFLLEYSYQKDVKAAGIAFKPEFVRLRVTALPKQLGLGASAATLGSTGQRVSKTALLANVTRDPSGDVFIKNMPMVDQGPKGYCAVATAERVFRYYGMPVDQNEMAQVAKTGAGGGTDPSKMLEALTALQGRLHVHVRAISKWEYAEFSRMIADYNREAKKNKKTEISITGMHTINIGAIYGAMDPASLKDSKTVRKKGDFEKFKREVAEKIDKGIPVMWGVELGLYPEPEIPQAEGGHMRLIIGYNGKTNEIIYSDSWGAKHAMKRMPSDNAFAMTTGLYFMEPFE
ncbi:MAG: C39 family peptidase [Chthoniobacteraceae bacterium]